MNRFEWKAAGCMGGAEERMQRCVEEARKMLHVAVDDENPTNRLAITQLATKLYDSYSKTFGDQI
jgi:hypothetical protein